jgi:hypothetical protein
MVLLGNIEFYLQLAVAHLRANPASLVSGLRKGQVKLHDWIALPRYPKLGFK